jgi:quercetin dioxygenase-like cupin family protein
MKLSGYGTLFLGSLAAAAVAVAQQQSQVIRDKMEATVKIEKTVGGHLAEINGKYKLRASESVYQPGGMIGEHHHVGPGIRYVKAGTLRYVQGEKTTLYHEGDYFYETGDVTHTALVEHLLPGVEPHALDARSPRAAALLLPGGGGDGLGAVVDRIQFHIRHAELCYLSFLWSSSPPGAEAS